MAAAVAGAAGALRECRLVGPPADSAWGDLFGDENAINRIVDARRMAISAAARLLDEQTEDAPGRVFGMLPGDPDHPDIEHALRNIACRRGIEAVLHLPALAVPDEPDGMTLIAAGQLRPERLAEPPPQAMRVIRGEVTGDLRRWLDEAIRGRARLAGEDASEARQAPYVPMSRLGQARCTIARSHQVAASIAGRNLVTRRGPVDDFAARILGTDPAGLEARYSPEQIDAIAMAEDAYLRGRAFLLGDQTGTGKGRACAGMAISWLRRNPDHRVVYMTLGNVAGDVMRDLRATNALDVTERPVLLGNDMPEMHDAHTPGGAERRAILESRAFPDGARFVVCTYSSLQMAQPGDLGKTPAERRGAEWFAEVADDPNTMVILDESQMAINPLSNLGMTMRTGIANAGRVAFATATAMRSAAGVDLYRHLMPESLQELPRFEGRIQRSLGLVGETAQESFITMLTEDGVMLRRDHDTGLVPYSVDTPSETESALNREAMRQVAVLAERLMDLSRGVNRWYRVACHHLEERAEGGFRPAAETLEAMMTGGFGGPLDQIARATLVALKVPQAVRLAETEIRKGRKPMISMSSTAGTFMERVCNGEVVPPEDRPLDLRDHLRAIAARSCLVTGLARIDRIRGIEVEGDRLDLRDHSGRIRDLWREVSEAVEAMPAGLPVSPGDALRDGLQRAGISSGEITGREFCIDAGGEVVRRAKPHKQEIGRQYNAGEIDVLIYNEAGGTGASYHASAGFADQRPRTILQLELPLDVLRHLQSMGRGNRYDQVAIPDFITLSTDTLAEQRLLAGNNRKLRTCGAILDGNRDHPALARDVPDLFNGIGQEACREVMNADPVLARRFDLRPDRPNLAKSIFTRAILLPEDEQVRLFNLITAEYDSQLAEADARGVNPLTVPSLDGYVEIESTEPFATGEENKTAGREDSVFHRPLMLSTGIWRRPPGLPAAAVTAAAMNAIQGDGGGLVASSRMARDLTARWHEVTRTIPADKLRPLIEMLETFEPGRVMWPPRGSIEPLVVVEYLPPEQFMADRPYGHRFRCIAPGDGEFQTWSAAALIKEDYRPREMNILDDDVHWVANRFDTLATAGNRRAVQVLSGDLLSVGGAMSSHAVASRHYRVVTFNDQSGTSRRAAVNSDPKHMDLKRLPFRISANSMLDAAADCVGAAPGASLRLPSAEQEMKDGKANTDRKYRSWLIRMNMTMEDGPVLRIALPSMADKLRQSFWDVGTGPEIYRTAAGKDLAEFSKDRKSVRRRQVMSFQLDDQEEMAAARRLCTLVDRHPASSLLAPGWMRRWWSSEGQEMARTRVREFAPLPAGGLVSRLKAALGGPDPLDAARVRWSGGDVVISAVPGMERPGTVVSLPAHDRRSEEFWSGETGAAIWETAFDEPMPDRPSANRGRPRTVFLERDDALKLAGMLERRALEMPGWSISAADYPPEEAEREMESELAAC